MVILVSQLKSSYLCFIIILTFRWYLHQSFLTRYDFSCKTKQEVFCFAKSTDCAQHKRISQTENSSKCPLDVTSLAESSGSRLRLTQAAAFASLSNQWAFLHTGLISLCGLRAALNSNGVIKALVEERYSRMMDLMPRQEGQGRSDRWTGRPTTRLA